MRDSGKDVQVNIREEREFRGRAKEHPDLDQSEVYRTGARVVMDGKEFAEAEHVNDRVFEAFQAVESEYRAIEAELSNATPELAERLREARLSAAHEVTRACYERVQEAEAEVAQRESDPDATSPGCEKSPLEAAESAIERDGTFPKGYISEGPENSGMQKHAKECGMDPKTFSVFLVEEFADVPIRMEGPFTRPVGEWMETKVEAAAERGEEFWYDGDEYGVSSEEADASQPLATDGGDSL